jgi:iron(III) transport system permease protein
LSAAACVLVSVLCLPLISLFSFGAEADAELWRHISRHVLPYALRDTFILTVGVAILVAVVGTALAALTAFCEFPCRRIIQWMAVLPLAFPTYLSAYTHVELLDASGPVQQLLRNIAGPDLRLPEIRSTGGAILIFSLVLFPYVYLPARIAFARQSADFIDTAHTLGCRPFEAFWRINLPLARPAIAGGTALALMETLSDIGAAEYLGVRTLAVTIYTTWLSRGSIGVAGQLALLLLLVTVALLVSERVLRGDASVVADGRPPSRIRPGQAWQAAATVFCALPIVIAFIVPFGFLFYQALRRVLRQALATDLAPAALSTFVLAVITAALVVTTATLLAIWARHASDVVNRVAPGVLSYGYAMPSVVLALCIVFPAGALDNAINGLVRGFAGLNPGLVLTTAGAVLLYGFWVRFMAVGYQLVDAGLKQLNPDLERVSRSLGCHFYAMLGAITLPLIAPSLLGAAALVFVDVIKELPLTLLLRPIGIETLATSLYGHASRGSFEDGAAEALLIALSGLLAVAILPRTALRPRW